MNYFKKDKIIKKTLLNVDISVISKIQLLDFIEENIFNNSKCIVNYVNIHAINLAYDNDHFKTILNKSSILFCDGYGILLGSRILGLTLGERMTPPDWVDDLLERLERNKKTIFLLGDEQNVIKKMEHMIKIKYPDLHISGCHHGFFNKSNFENEVIIDSINKSKTNVIITGMGMPIQETWAYENIENLNVNCILSTGALFRWYTNTDKRGPKLLTDNGLEWLMRLFVQPHKVWRRYIIGIPKFFLRLILHKYKIHLS